MAPLPLGEAIQRADDLNVPLRLIAVEAGDQKAVTGGPWTGLNRC